MSAMQREAALMMQQSFTMMSQPVNENSDPSSLKTTKNHYECDRIMSPLPNRLGSKQVSPLEQSSYIKPAASTKNSPFRPKIKQQQPYYTQLTDLQTTNQSTSSFLHTNQSTGNVQLSRGMNATNGQKYDDDPVELQESHLRVVSRGLYRRHTQLLPVETHAGTAILPKALAPPRTSNGDETPSFTSQDKDSFAMNQMALMRSSLSKDFAGQRKNRQRQTQDINADGDVNSLDRASESESCDLDNAQPDGTPVLFNEITSTVLPKVTKQRKKVLKTKMSHLLMQKKRLQILNECADKLNNNRQRLSGTNTSFENELQPSLLFSAPQRQQQNKQQRSMPQIVKQATLNKVGGLQKGQISMTSQSELLGQLSKSGTERMSYDFMRKLQQKSTAAVATSYAPSPWSDCTSLNNDMQDDVVVMLEGTKKLKNQLQTESDQRHSNMSLAQLQAAVKGNLVEIFSPKARSKGVKFSDESPLQPLKRKTLSSFNEASLPNFHSSTVTPNRKRMGSLLQSDINNRRSQNAIPELSNIMTRNTRNDSKVWQRKQCKRIMVYNQQVPTAKGKNSPQLSLPPATVSSSPQKPVKRSNRRSTLRNYNTGLPPTALLSSNQ